jgi:hypothetical protein
MQPTPQHGRRGPVEGEQVIGWDSDPARRPGVPMRAEPSRDATASAGGLEDQPGWERREHRSLLDRPTPVFGTAQPLHGVSGAIRRAAYRVPEHHPRHWMLLMAGDRVDVLEDRLGRLAVAPLSAVGAHALAHRVRSSPIPYALGTLLVGALAFTATRARRMRRS